MIPTDRLEKIYQSIEFIETVQSKYSLVCSLLELSRNWDLFVKNWFRNSNFNFLFEPHVTLNTSNE
jgi:hypothetical protein